jgi:endonuclease YncB( thermonuclease family)
MKRLILAIFIFTLAGIIGAGCAQSPAEPKQFIQAAQQSTVTENSSTANNSAPVTDSALQQSTISGKVIAIHDGDTITVIDASNVQHKIRLAGIDAPELRQDFGDKAKQNLSGLIFGKTIEVITTKTDKYGRTVGKVLLNGEDINLRQIKDGFAWHYKEYENEQTLADRKLYAQAELDARDAASGLWFQSNFVAPWDYRKGVRSENKKLDASSQKSQNVPTNSQAQTTTVSESRSTISGGREYITGPRGGCYYINASGNKTYVDRSLCGNSTASEPIYTQKSTSASSLSRYIRGPRGGCYYINSRGNKTYVDRSLCN